MHFCYIRLVSSVHFFTRVIYGVRKFWPPGFAVDALKLTLDKNQGATGIVVRCLEVFITLVSIGFAIVLHDLAV